MPGANITKLQDSCVPLKCVMVADFLQHVVIVPDPQPVISRDEMFICALIFDKMHPSAVL